MLEEGVEARTFEELTHLEFLLLELLPAHPAPELVTNPSGPASHAFDTLDQLVEAWEGLLVLGRVAERRGEAVKVERDERGPRVLRK